MPRPLRLVCLALLVGLPLQSCSAHRSPATPESQIRFGVSMAQKGLWSEALFRFQEAERLGGGGDAHILNDLAVAMEALGRFDDALAYYKRGLAQAPSSRELKTNYDRFVSFYESYRARGEQKPGQPAKASVPASDNGTAAPTRPTPLSPPLGGVAPPTHVEPPDQPPLIPPGVEPAPQPQPTPPGATLRGGHHD